MGLSPLILSMRKRPADIGQNLRGFSDDNVCQNKEELVGTIRKLTASGGIENELWIHGKDGFCGSVYRGGARGTA